MFEIEIRSFKGYRCDDEIRSSSLEVFEKYLNSNRFDVKKFVTVFYDKTNDREYVETEYVIFRGFNSSTILKRYKHFASVMRYLRKCYFSDLYV